MDTAIDPRVENFKRERAARRHVEALKGFYIHAAVFGAVIAGLVVVNAMTGGPWWVLWVVGGWGIGLAAHAFGVYAPGSQRVSKWEERKVAEFQNRPRT